MDPQNPIQQPTQPMPPVKQQSSFPWIKVILVVVACGILFTGLGYYLGNKTNETSSSSLSNSLNTSSGTQTSVNPPNSQITPLASPIPTVDPTANWKTYTSKENDFSFKYPLDWNPCKNTQACFDSPNIQRKTINEDSPIGGTIIVSQGGSFSVETRSQKTNLVKLSEVCHPGGPIFVRSCEQISLNGLPAMKRIEGKDENATIVFVSIDKFFYVISMNYVSTDSATKNLLDQILSTFKFTP